MKVAIKNSVSGKQKVLQNLVYFTGCVFSLEKLVNFFPVYFVNHILQKCLSVIIALQYLRIFIAPP